MQGVASARPLVRTSGFRERSVRTGGRAEATPYIAYFAGFFAAAVVVAPTALLIASIVNVPSGPKPMI
jgi:hypothetical protein